MTPAEKLMGRLMRAPDGHEGDAAPAAQAPVEGEGEQAPAGDVVDTGDAAGGGDQQQSNADEGGEAAAASLMNQDEGDGQSGDDDNGAEADPVPEGDYTLELPEGVELDATLLGEATPILKEVGLGSKAASKLVPLVTKVQEQTAEAVQQQIIDTHQATVADWAKETLADPELGGKNWKSTQDNVAKALDHFIGPKELTDDKGEKLVGDDGKPQLHPFRQMLDDTGLGSNPHMIRAFAAIGKALGEETTIARGAGGGDRPKSRAEQLYGDQAKPRASE